MAILLDENGICWGVECVPEGEYPRPRFGGVWCAVGTTPHQTGVPVFRWMPDDDAEGGPGEVRVARPW